MSDIDPPRTGRQREPGRVESSLGPRLSSVIATTRRHLGWTLEQLAIEADVSPAQISRIENGRAQHGPVDQIARLLDAMSVRLDVVIGPPAIIDPPAPRDAASSRVVAYAVRHLERAGVIVACEVGIGGGARPRLDRHCRQRRPA